MFVYSQRSPVKTGVLCFMYLKIQFQDILISIILFEQLNHNDKYQYWQQQPLVVLKVDLYPSYA